MKKIFLLFLLCVLFLNPSFAQEDTTFNEPVEIFLVENFVTPEKPHTFKLSFFTSSAVKSKLTINDSLDFEISDVFTENHNKDIDLTNLAFKEQYVPFIITVEDSAGNTYESELYEFELPREVQIEGESNFLLLCLFGGVVFGLPGPGYVIWGDDDYFTLTKEIPLLFIRSSGYSYPAGYFSLEYSYIFDAPVNHFLRVGYKHLIEIPGIEYISPGINGFTNFNGFNGISPEVSFGLFKILNTFTLYARYRFNAKPGDSSGEFHEISLGLYSGFFAIYL